MENKSVTPPFARVEKDGAFWDVVIDLHGRDLPIYFSMEEEFHAVRKCQDLNAAAEKWKEEAVREAAKEVSHRMKEELRAIHGLAENCKQEGGECSICSFIDCPFSDSLHYHHDGCPSEYMADGEAVRAAEDRVWAEVANIGDLIDQLIGIATSHAMQTMDRSGRIGRLIADAASAVSALRARKGAS